MKTCVCLLFVFGVILMGSADPPPVDCNNPPRTLDMCDNVIAASMATTDPKNRKVSFNTAHQLFCSSTLLRECRARSLSFVDMPNKEVRTEISLQVRGQPTKLYMYTPIHDGENPCVMTASGVVTPTHCAAWLRRVAASTSRTSVALASAQQYICLQSLAANCGVELDSELPPFDLRGNAQMVEIQLTAPMSSKVGALTPQFVHTAREIQHVPCSTWNREDKVNCLQWLIESKMTADKENEAMIEDSSLVCMRTMSDNCGATLKGYLDTTKDNDNPLVQMVLEFPVRPTSVFAAQNHYGYVFLSTWKSVVGYPLENDPERKYA